MDWTNALTGAIGALGGGIATVAVAYLKRRGDRDKAGLDHDEKVSPMLMKRIEALEQREQERSKELAATAEEIGQYKALIKTCEERHKDRDELDASRDEEALRRRNEVATLIVVNQELTDEVERLSGGHSTPKLDAARAALHRATAPPSPTGCTILLVDDQVATLSSMARSLETLGHRVIPVTSMALAMNVITSGRDHVDVILSDVMMPGRTGIDLLKRMRELRSRVPVILYTGDPTQVPEGTAVEVLTKPVDRETLRRAIAGALDDTSRFKLPGR